MPAHVLGVVLVHLAAERRHVVLESAHARNGSGRRGRNHVGAEGIADCSGGRSAERAFQGCTVCRESVSREDEADAQIE